MALIDLARRLPLPVKRMGRRLLLGDAARPPVTPTAPQPSPFVHYNTSFDPIGVILSHEFAARTPKPGHAVNYMGVAMNVKFVPFLEFKEEVEPPPIPSNWHADIAEFGAALRAVDLARDSFVMIELGCGWGCWMNITGVAAKRRNLAVEVIGVEGDEGHIGFAKEALATNGFQPGEYTLYNGVAAANSGFALFPRQTTAGESWGLEPTFNATPEQRAEALRTGRFQEIPMLSLAEVIGERPRIDLLHIDIQGGEADLVRDCLELLTAKVAYIVIGTHSREIEGRIFETFAKTGWQLEIERPAIFAIVEGKPSIRVDGVQGWRNPALLPQ